MHDENPKVTCNAVYMRRAVARHRFAGTSQQWNGNQTTARDPGVRANAVGAGEPISGLSSDETEYFQNGLASIHRNRFGQGNSARRARGRSGAGFNSNSCVSCHAQPSIGGSSPSVNAYPNIGSNPQVAVATDDGARNSIPFFITSDGPVREARFPFVVNASGSVTQTPDGGVHDLFTIAGRSDAPGCNMQQPNFEQAQQLNNLIFRIPTPTFRRGPDRKHSGCHDSRQHEFQLSAETESQYFWPSEYQRQ